MTASYFRLKLSPEKTSIGLSKQNILGYSISQNSIHRLPQHRVISIEDIPSPNSKKEFSSFLGLTAWLCHFTCLRDASLPLRKLEKSNVKFKWNDELNSKNARD
jgi:hypothetical protein